MGKITSSSTYNVQCEPVLHTVAREPVRLLPLHVVTEPCISLFYQADYDSLSRFALTCYRPLTFYDGLYRLIQSVVLYETEER